MHRVPTKKHFPRARYTWRERAFVFAGIGVAGGASGIGAPLGAGEDILAPVWLGAIGWTVLASLAHALWRGFRRGDWSAFRDCEPPEPDRGAGDCAIGTDAYAYAYRQLTDPMFRHLPGNAHYSSTDYGARWFTDPAWSSLPGNVHYHSSSD